MKLLLASNLPWDIVSAVIVAIVVGILCVLFAFVFEKKNLSKNRKETFKDERR